MKHLGVLLVLVAGAYVAPVQAQEMPFSMGDFWDVTTVEFVDGQEQVYMEELARNWKAGQEFSKTKGWITGYKVIANYHARDNEPDLYLVTTYDKTPAAEEEAQRMAEYETWAAANLPPRRTDMASIRRLAGSQLLREILLK